MTPQVQGHDVIVPAQVSGGVIPNLGAQANAVGHYQGARVRIAPIQVMVVQSVGRDKSALWFQRCLR